MFDYAGLGPSSLKTGKYLFDQLENQFDPIQESK